MSPNNQNEGGSDGGHNYSGTNTAAVTSENTNTSSQPVLDDGTTVVDTTTELADLLLEKIQDIAGVVWTSTEKDALKAALIAAKG